ncbi:hypothetical protein B795N_00300 [Marinilactibacillus psychrotolerans]|uniref:hypothetical protein n=1 Tax=Marinilactibacillus psychrotolerans TaxID=191770 RepID=UPI001C7DC874|nr:hypothetical protein [Marinilactibacillus psychrotolerans]GEQ32148.1 hypothetical protein B795N_00300 [Marinilactibacillus psychrotolerans]
MNNLKKDIEELRRRKPSNSLGYLISIFSIWYGFFNIQNDFYLIGLIEPYLQHIVSIKFIGYCLVLFGMLKLIGIIKNNTLARKLGIWSLTGMWSGLFALALTFSFGTGYPHATYGFNALVLVLCLIVSFKGDYKE